MDYKELQDILSSLDFVTNKLEEIYIATEGECTETTELMEAEVTALRTLVNTEGVDYLGRWLKAKEDRKKALKAEKDFLSRQMEANDKTIEFIKAKIRSIMDLTGCEKVKGSLGYSFATTVSTKTDVDKDLLKEYFQAKVEEVLKDILPPDITVTLGASVSRLGDLADDAELPVWYHRTETPTVRFTKPRAKKED